MGSLTRVKRETMERAQGKGWLDATEDALQPSPWSSISYYNLLAQSWSIKPERFHEVVAIAGVTALRIANSLILP